MPPSLFIISGCSNRTWKTEALADAEAYFTEIGSTNSAYETNVEDWARRIGASPTLYPALKQQCSVYLGFPESETTASYPFWRYNTDSRFTTFTYPGQTDLVLNINSATWSAALGWQGDGATSSFLIGSIMGQQRSLAGTDQRIFYTYITGSSGNSWYLGNTVNTASRIYIGDANVASSLTLGLQRDVLTAPGDYSSFVGGLLIRQGGAALMDHSSPSEYSADLRTSDDNYAAAVANDSNSIASVVLQGTRPMWINAWSSLAETDFTSLAGPSIFGQQYVGSIIYGGGLSSYDDAILLAQATDQLNSDFGR